jgi:hypothetical protein
MMSHQLLFGSLLVIFALRAASAVNKQVFFLKIPISQSIYFLSPIQVSIREIPVDLTQEDIAAMITNGISIEDGIAMSNSISEEEFIEMLPTGMSEDDAVASMVADLTPEDIANAVASMSIGDARTISNRIDADVNMGRFERSMDPFNLKYGLTQEEMTVLTKEQISALVFPELEEEKAMAAMFDGWESKEEAIQALYDNYDFSIEQNVDMFGNGAFGIPGFRAISNRNTDENIVEILGLTEEDMLALTEEEIAALLFPNKSLEDAMELFMGPVGSKENAVASMYDQLQKESNSPTMAELLNAPTPDFASGIDFDFDF